MQMAATSQQHRLILALTLPLRLNGQRLTWETRPVCLVHVLSLQVHWQGGRIAIAVAHSHKEQTGRQLMTAAVKPGSQ